MQQLNLEGALYNSASPSNDGGLLMQFMAKHRAGMYDDHPIVRCWVTNLMLESLIPDDQYPMDGWWTIKELLKEVPSVSTIVDNIFEGLDEDTIYDLETISVRTRYENSGIFKDWMSKCSGRTHASILDGVEYVHKFLLKRIVEYDMRRVIQLDLMSVRGLPSNNFTINPMACKRRIEELKTLLEATQPGDKDWSEYMWVPEFINKARCTPFGSPYVVPETPINAREISLLKVNPVVEEFYEHKVAPYLLPSAVDSELNLFGAAVFLYAAYRSLCNGDFHRASEQNASDLDCMITFFDPYSNMDIWSKLVSQETLDSKIFNEMFYPGRDTSGIPAIYNFRPSGLSYIYDLHLPQRFNKYEVSEGYELLARATRFILSNPGGNFPVEAVNPHTEKEWVKHFCSTWGQGYDGSNF